MNDVLLLGHTIANCQTTMLVIIIIFQGTVTEATTETGDVLIPSTSAQVNVQHTYHFARDTGWTDDETDDEDADDERYQGTIAIVCLLQEYLPGWLVGCSPEIEEEVVAGKEYLDNMSSFLSARALFAFQIDTTVQLKVYSGILAEVAVLLYSSSPTHTGFLLHRCRLSIVDCATI